MNPGFPTNGKLFRHRTGTEACISGRLIGLELHERLSEAIRRQAVEASNRQNCLSIKARLARPTLREREVLKQILHGHLNRQIAATWALRKKP